MSKIHCVIVDDEPVAQRIIESYLGHFSEYYVVAKCNNALEARTVLMQKPIDLMFLDLEMPKLKGLSFLRTLKSKPMVIVTTAHREFAIESFELEVLDYLLKPISVERFIRALNRFREIYDLRKKEIKLSKSDDHIFVTADRKSVKVIYADIEYIQGMSNYIKIKMLDRSLMVYGTLMSILKKLDHRFVQIHRSYIINRDHLRAFSKEHVEINEKTIPVGKSFRRLLDIWDK